ncbi:MAG: GNAT family N-acetyltransferase [Pseudomonadota bacterium]
MKFTDATTKDASAIAEINRLSRRHAMPWLPVVHTPEEDLEFFRDNVLTNQTVYVARIADEVVGFIAYQSDWLNHLYVTPEHLRGGVGSKLLSMVQNDSACLQLWTFQENHGARAFYKKHGFEEVELTDGVSNEEKTPDVRMTWIKT